MITVSGSSCAPPHPDPSAPCARAAARADPGRGGTLSATRDHAEILHLAGRLRRSPALRQGAPLLAAAEDGAGRCGWPRFFEALEAQGLAVEAQGDGAGELVPAASARPARPSLRARAREAGRFLRALGGAPGEPGRPPP